MELWDNCIVFEDLPVSVRVYWRRTSRTRKGILEQLHLSPRLIKYKKDHEICHVNPDPSLEEAKYGVGVKTLNGSQPSDYFNIW
jgi:hypothetical protein